VVTGAAWTISLECMFYLVFPFLARFALERGKRYLFELLVLMAFFKLAAYPVNANSTLMYFCTFIGRFDQFLIGMLAAMVYREHRVLLHRFAPWLLLPAAALVVLDTATLHLIAPFGVTPKSTFWIFWSMLESLGWAGLIMAWIAFQPRLPELVERALCQGGKISFSFYLLHMGMLHLLATRFGLVRPTGNGWVDAAIMLSVTYGVTWGLATLSYHAIEEPFLRMRRRYGAKNPMPARVVHPFHP
jgi:peptidoglycan/LPS O-acetylase OafA/YrhL